MDLAERLSASALRWRRHNGLSAVSSTGWDVFFTVNLLERRLDTLVQHIDVLRDAVQATKRARPFYIDAWMVLPDHMHCVWTLPPGDTDFSNRWKAIKIRFVQKLPCTERRSNVRSAKGERQLNASNHTPKEMDVRLESVFSFRSQFKRNFYR